MKAALRIAVMALLMATVGVGATRGQETYTEGNITWELLKINVGKKTCWIKVAGSTGELTEVVIPSVVKDASGNALHVVRIAKYGFDNCQQVTKVPIPHGITHIEERGFSGCSKLIAVNVLETVKTIGKRPFYSCTSLLSITLREV